MDISFTSTTVSQFILHKRVLKEEKKKAGKENKEEEIAFSGDFSSE